MASRYRSLTLYSLFLALVTAGWLARELGIATDFPPAWAAALLIAACLFVWQFGLPAPRVGLTSMERLPQVGLLLVLDPPVAAVICGLASLLWPLFNREYRQGSLRVAALRGVHNASMTALMLLLAGAAYRAAGGEHPLTRLGSGDVWPLVILAATAQVVNVSLLALYFRLDGRDVRRLIKPVYTLIDLVFVPAGVLAALLYNTGSPAAFALFMLLMGVFVISFNQIGHALGAAAAQNAPLETLSSARKALRGARRVDEVGKQILAEARSLFRFDEFALLLVDREAEHSDVRVHERHGRLLADEARLHSGLCGRVIANGKPELIDGSLMAVPLVDDDVVIGVLLLQHDEAGAWSGADLHLLQQLAEQAAAAVADAQAFEDLEGYRQDLEERVAKRTGELEQANREKERLIAALRERSRALERESQEDPLTGIANRRHFSQRLEAEIEVALSVGQPLTLAVADLDHFKVVNDCMGHTVGDEVLRQSAALMREMCRATDLVARIGGEEFALILPGMSRGAAIGFCENLRHAVESHCWNSVHPGLSVTLSIGLSQWDGIADPSAFLRAADTQMYRAKGAGRNRVA